MASQLDALSLGPCYTHTPVWQQRLGRGVWAAAYLAFPFRMEARRWNFVGVCGFW